MTAQSVTAFLCPPAYPEQLHPFTCRHEPQYQMMADAWSEKGRIRLDSPMCMACGRPLPGTNGNVFACIAECHVALGCQPQIGQQLLYLRERYLRLAVRLFGPTGWMGRHRTLSEMIDPNLTMRIEPDVTHLDGTRFFAVSIDETYFSGRRAA